MKSLQKFVQAVPALLGTVVILALAVALFVPRNQLPRWLTVRIPNSLTDPATLGTNESKSTDVPAQSPESQPASLSNTAVVAKTTTPVSPAKPFVAPQPERTRPENDPELMNCLFTELPEHPTAAPRVVDLPFPKFPHSYAIWAGTGRDVQGRVWIGGCVEGDDQYSARLFCYDTRTGEMSDFGDVLSALRDNGRLRAGECQAKIHSKIIQAQDGHLYFATMDEQGENPDGSQLSTWGGHFWRLRMPERKWELLHSTPQPLIAVAGMGRYMYALGYFGHVLVQYDTETGSIQTVTVGSVDGHVSRNFLADLHGHAYVPRLTRSADSDDVTAELVEFDPQLQEVGATRLSGYCDNTPTKSHGITGVQPLADGSLAFVTHRGRLFHIVPKADEPAEVKDLGWMHPIGEMPIESLFSYDGQTWLMAVTQFSNKKWEWVSYNLQSAAASAQTLDVPVCYASVSRGLLLYGSMTRDLEGAFYLVGTSMEQPPYGPVVWRLMPN